MKHNFIGSVHGQAGPVFEQPDLGNNVLAHSRGVGLADL